MAHKVLGLDFETSDANAATTRITEVGAVLYNVKDNKWAVEKKLSALCFEPDYPPQSEEIVEITGITDQMLKTNGVPRRAMLESLLPLVAEADVIMAHKISFDRTVLQSTCKLFDLKVPEKFWLCTLTNFNWPAKYTCRKLSHLAYEHSILVDPATLHRAVADVDLMAQLVSVYDFEKVMDYAQTPWIYVRAADIMGPWLGKGGDGGVQTTIAKSLGFGWEQIKGVDEHRWPKTWVTRVKENTFDDLQSKILKSKSPFRIQVIEGLN